ncbi:hypothetical protein [Streptomyces syringium]|uniref:hypothetical protein n=1 Tax=Streptomyces syringium TaxID=76729 RepID=UPI0037D342BF
MTDERNERAAPRGQTTLTINVAAPNQNNADRWAEGIRDLVNAEFGDSMRLEITIGHPGAHQLRALLARLIADGAHHAQCATLSRTEEGQLTHDGFAAGFHLAAMCTADLLAVGQLQGSFRAVCPEGRAAAERVIDTLSEDPSERARAIGAAIRGTDAPISAALPAAPGLEHAAGPAGHCHLPEADSER